MLRYSNQPEGGAEIGRMIVSGMKADRKAMFSSDLLRVLGFAGLIAALLYLRRRKIISSLISGNYPCINKYWRSFYNR
ncbi:MAG: hypothetical protein WKF59_21750 [Chitinophagaceae bacterium]